MTCRDFEQHLEHCVENRHNPDVGRFQTHLAQCAACRERWDEFALLQSAVSHLTELDQVPDLADRVLNTYRGTPAAPSATSPSFGRRLAQIVAVVVAAGVLLMVMLPGIMGLFQGNALVTQNGNDDDQQTVAVTKDTPPAEPMRLGQLVREADTAFKSLWDETGGTFGGVASLVPTSPAEEEMPVDDQPIATHVQRDLQPLGRKFRDSMSFLMRGPASP